MTKSAEQIKPGQALVDGTTGNMAVLQACGKSDRKAKLMESIMKNIYDEQKAGNIPYQMADDEIEYLSRVCKNFSNWHEALRLT
jgi:hypothetical protein